MKMINILKVTVLVGVLILLGYSGSMKTLPQTHSLVLQNIEALANSEYSMDDCIGSGSVNCPINHVKVKYVIQGYSL